MGNSHQSVTPRKTYEFGKHSDSFGLSITGLSIPGRAIDLCGICNDDMFAFLETLELGVKGCQTQAL